MFRIFFVPTGSKKNKKQKLHKLGEILRTHMFLQNHATFFPIQR